MRIKNTAELEKYLPMPHVFLKVGLGVVIKLALGLFIWRLLGDWLSGSLVRAAVFGVVFAVTYIVFWSALVLKNNNPFSWLKEYWRRNVRGYSLLCVRHGNGTVNYEILKSDEAASTTQPALILKLGGLFKSRRSSCLGPHGWRVRFTGLENNTVMVRLTDRAGKSFIVSAAEALGALWEEMSSGGSSNGTWRGIFRLISIERDIYRRQVDEAWQKMDGLEWRLDWTRQALLSFHQRATTARKRKDFR